MIFYFSATGNCKYVAEKLSEATGEAAVSIIECIRSGRLAFDIREDERIGFVTPTHFLGLPVMVIDFLERMELKAPGRHYVYHILTYGTFTGAASRMMGGYLEKKGLSLSGRFNIYMVDTWTPVFNLSDKEKTTRITDAAGKKINEVSLKVKERIAGDFDNRKLPSVSSLYWKFKNVYGRKTKKFKVGDSCSGCGLCSKVCPAGAIEIKDGRPFWITEQCHLCLGCLHRCPKNAIQYGLRTKNHGQFVNPYVKL